MTKRTKEEFVALIRADREFWRSLVDDVGRDLMNEPGPMGEWTFKDLAAHLAGWRNYRIAQVEAVARGEPDPRPPWPADLHDDDPINDWIHEHSQDRPLEDVLADYDSTFERYAAAIEAIPESMLEDPNAFPWVGGQSILDGDPTEHLHGEHAPSVRAWLASR